MHIDTNTAVPLGLILNELFTNAFKYAVKIKHLLVEIGYAVCEPVSDYDEAVEMLRTESPDLLLLDINLGGGKDGLDVAKHINDLYQLPFIFLTANNDKATIERAKVVRHLPEDKFYRTHRSYAIYTDYIDNIEYAEVVVAGQKVPLSSSYRQGLFDLLGIK